MIGLRAADCGFTWYGGTGCASSVLGTGGVESGMSFQNYNISDILVYTENLTYDCCPNRPWPQVFYKVSLERAPAYYVWKMLLPVLLLVMSSFIQFFMSPATGERLGFAITVILAVVATDIVASSLMPICNEQLWMGTVIQLCFMYSFLGLLETAIVLSLYHCTEEDWNAFLPKCLRLKCLRRCFPESPRRMSRRSDSGESQRAPSEVRSVPSQSSQSSQADIFEGEQSGSLRSMRRNASMISVTHDTEASRLLTLRRQTKDFAQAMEVEKSKTLGTLLEFDEAPSSPSSRTSLTRAFTNGIISDWELCAFWMRAQLYKQAFYILDADFSGDLSADEIDAFGSFMLGGDWTEQLFHAFMEMADKDTSGTVTEQEFVDLAESVIVGKIAGGASASVEKTTEFVVAMIQGFLEMVERRARQNVAMWQHRAAQVDSAAIAMIPFTFFVLLVEIWVTRASTSDQMGIHMLVFLMAALFALAMNFGNRVIPGVQKKSVAPNSASDSNGQAWATRREAPVIPTDSDLS